MIKEKQVFYEEQNLNIRKLLYEKKILKEAIKVKEEKGSGEVKRFLRKKVKKAEFPEIIESLILTIENYEIRINGKKI